MIASVSIEPGNVDRAPFAGARSPVSLNPPPYPLNLTPQPAGPTRNVRALTP